MGSRQGIPDNVPYLLPLHGPSDRRPRMLDRDVSTIGRARGCDLCLEASDVSTIHCVLFRGPHSYHVRDCNSRTGTRVNGETFRGARKLHDSDILQIGPFSFEVHVPTLLSSPDLQLPDPVQLLRFEQSRRRFAGHAMRLRRILHESARGVTAREAELQQELARVEEKVRTYERRLHELNAADRDLEDDREKHHRHVQQVEGDLARRLEEVDQQVIERWQEFQRRCQAEGMRLAVEAEQPVPACATTGEPSAGIDETVSAREQAFAEREQQIAQQLQALHAQRREFDTMKQQLENGKAETAAALDKQRAALAQQEAALRGQRVELARMLNELRALQEELSQPYQAQLTALAAENEQLRKAVADLDARLAHSAVNGGAGRELKEARAESELLRMLLKDRECELAGAMDELAAAPRAEDSGAAVAALEALRSENHLLTEQLAQMDTLVAELRARLLRSPRSPPMSWRAMRRS